MRRSLENNTWLVFLVGLGSLLALLFLPVAMALRRTERVYQEIRRIQQAHERAERTIGDIERQLYRISIFVREYLLDDSPEASSGYRAAAGECRRQIEASLPDLRGQNLGPGGTAALDVLEQQMAQYWAAVEPISNWSPEERRARATWFLRQQQRPRRQNILAISDELSRVNDAAYQRQYSEVENSQQSFRADMWKIMAAALLIGSAISAASILRISQLEARDSAHRVATEEAGERMRLLSTQLMQAQEEERRNLSRELHDEVGQLLTALRMDLGTLERLRDDSRFSEHLSEAKDLAEKALRTVRNIAVGLRPSVLDLGLAPALQSQAREISRRFPVNVSVHTTGDLDHIPDKHRTCLYRLVQECLTNVVRHSSARSVNIDLKEQKGVLDLEVRDDGMGFSAETQKEGTGLIGMRERVRELGGTLMIDSNPGSGTAVRVRLALPV